MLRQPVPERPELQHGHCPRVSMAGCAEWSAVDPERVIRQNAREFVPDLGVWPGTSAVGVHVRHGICVGLLLGACRRGGLGRRHVVCLWNSVPELWARVLLRGTLVVKSHPFVWCSAWIGTGNFGWRRRWRWHIPRVIRVWHRRAILRPLEVLYAMITSEADVFGFIPTCA